MFWLECIAAFTKRPLMILTASDVGTNPEQVEGTLARHFKLAQSWSAVLLIDEADVFMERRSTNDLLRNSLVAGELPWIGLCYSWSEFANDHLKASLEPWNTTKVSYF